MIHEPKKIEYCVIVEYEIGDKFCIAKFMHEEDARRYKRSRKKSEGVKWSLYERRAGEDGVTWIEME